MADVLAKLTGDVVGAVKGLLFRSLEPIQTRLFALETRAPEKGEKGDRGDSGRDGASVDLVALSGEIVVAAAKAVEALPKPKDGQNGRDFDPELLEAAVARRVAEIPKAKDGIDGKDFDPELMEAAILRRVSSVKDGVDGAPGKDADAAAITADVLARVSKTIDEMPKPKDGKDADPEAIKGQVLESVFKALDEIPKPRDGIDGKDADPESIKLAAAEVLPAMVDKAQAMLAERMQSNLAEMSGQLAATITDRVNALPKPKDGKDADAEAIKAEVLESVFKVFDQIPVPQDGSPGEKGEPGRDGKDFDPELIDQRVAERLSPMVEDARAALLERVDNAVKVIPVPKDGAPGARGEPGSRGEQGVNGKDADPELVAALVVEAVKGLLPDLMQKAVEQASSDLIAKMLAQVPKPEKGEPGKSVTPEDLAPLVQKEVKTAVEALPPPEPGRDGRDADVETIRSVVVNEIATLPRPKDGHDGQPGEKGDLGPRGERGADGFGLDDFDFEAKDDGRALVMKLASAGRQVVREVKTGFNVDRGVYKTGTGYERGDGVTYAGSYWFCLRDTRTSPPGDDWRLAVKRGKDAGREP